MCFGEAVRVCLVFFVVCRCWCGLFCLCVYVLLFCVVCLVMIVLVVCGRWCFLCGMLFVWFS